MCVRVCLRTRPCAHEFLFVFMCVCAQASKIECAPHPVRGEEFVCVVVCVCARVRACVCVCVCERNCVSAAPGAA